MEHCNGFPTPTKIEALLVTYKNISETKRNWTNSNALFIGIILYLASNIRPDISFSVHQCVLFTHNIKELHETSRKRIYWYLQGTNDTGIVFYTSKIIVAYCYEDEDFIRLWGHGNNQDPIYARSRTGFVVNFPILLFCGSQNYKNRFFSILYILVMWNCLTLLQSYFP